MNVIKVEGLSKKYQLGSIGYGSLYKDMSAWWASMRGKEDPNAIIGQKSRLGLRGDFWALSDVSFTVEKGQRVGIIGRNGAGKSTLLKMMSQISRPTNGEIRIKGRVASLLEVGTGFHPELTGRENVLLNGAILGMKRREIQAKFDEIVDFAGVEQFIDTPVKRYSSGMYVRLGFAVAAHLDSDILLVDEVLAVGDAEFQKKCLGKLENVSTQEGRTVVFVSHNMGAINRLCSHCLLLAKGLLIGQGITDAIIKKYLSINAVNGATFEQPHDASKDMNLRKVTFNSDGSESITEVRYDSPIRIQLEYEVNREVSNCTVWLAIENAEGIMAFTTADYDTDQRMLGARGTGHYHSDVLIPAKLLNSGSYYIIVGIVANHPLHVYDRIEAISFTVNEIGTPSSILEGGTRRGVFQPVLEWRNVKS